MPGPGKKFEKGAKAGPGRTPIPKEFKEQCRALTPLVLERWRVEVETSGEHWPKAAELLMAYGHGRPAQSLTGADGEGPVEIVVRTVTDAD